MAWAGVACAGVGAARKGWGRTPLTFPLARVQLLSAQPPARTVTARQSGRSGQRKAGKGRAGQHGPEEVSCRIAAVTDLSSHATVISPSPPVEQAHTSKQINWAVGLGSGLMGGTESGTLALAVQAAVPV